MAYALDRANKLRHVEFDVGFETIPPKALAPYISNEFTKIRSVTVPNTVVSIGDEAFSHSPGLTEVSLPENVEMIGDYAFEESGLVGFFRFPRKLKRLGIGAFKGCAGITEIETNDMLQHIGRHAFHGISASELTIPNTILSAAYAFEGAISINTVVIAAGTKRIPSKMFALSTPLSVQMPSSVEHIPYNAFEGATDVTIVATGDSFAKQFADENKINFIETT